MSKLFTLFAIVCHTLTAVTKAESDLAAQPGPTKKAAAITAAITAAMSLTGDLITPEKSQALTGAISSIVQATATIANLIGLFTHKAAPTPPVVHCDAPVD